MANKLSSHSKWKNVVRYINSIHDCMDGKTESEQIQLERDMYAWLEKNYQIGWNQKTLKQMRIGSLKNNPDNNNEANSEDSVNPPREP